MKKLALLSVVAAAAMFTACDDDSSTSSSGKLVSCDTKIEMSMLGVDFSALTVLKLQKAPRPVPT